MPPLLPVGRSRHAMPSWPEVLSHGTRGGEEPRRVPWGLEALQAPLPLAGRLMGVLRPVVERAVLAMCHPRQALRLGGAVAFALVGDDHSRHIGHPLQELTEQRLGRLRVAAALHQQIADGAS